MTDSRPPANDDTREILNDLLRLMREDRQTRQNFFTEIDQHLEDLLKKLDQRNTWMKWALLLVGLLALIVGGHMAGIIYSMNDDMGNMSQQMTQMSGDMRDMKVYMQYMPKMADDMGQMRQDMGAMNTYMSKMNDSIATVPQMQTDVNRMSNTMDRMQYDTALMRTGVGNMSRDTNAMGYPFHIMDSMIAPR